ncbi:MAG: hypothetical protein RLZZ15_2046, partial [Verrucomicrobiota bacterium]
DGPDWPIKAKDETPAKYIDLTREEAVELLALKGQPPERLDQLVAILKDTLAFDDPFGDMVEQTKVAEARDNPLLKNLERLGIPPDFPMTLTGLGADTLEFCRLEKLTTLGEFAVFAQTMAQNVIVGGDFRKLLNALSHVDEAALAEALPFRRGAKGLHLAETLAHAARSTNPATRAQLAVERFRGEFALLETDLAAGGALARHFVVIGDAALEAKAAALLEPHLKAPVRAPAPVEKKKGFFARLFGGK